MNQSKVKKTRFLRNGRSVPNVTAAELKVFTRDEKVLDDLLAAGFILPPSAKDADIWLPEGGGNG